jgi:release factor glutamine methyltransferase
LSRDDHLDAVVVELRAAGCVFAEDEAALLVASAPSPAELTRLVARRASGEPLEHIVGWVQFGGHRIVVAPGVFVPRQRTRCLAERAISNAQQRRTPVVVELCCGAAAIAHAVGVAVPDAELYATDVDERAVACARRNLEPFGGRILRGDLYSALPSQLLARVDVLVANAPYVPREELSLLPTEARDHEPTVALDGGRDGLAVLRKVIAGAPRWLTSGGVLLVECSRAQSERVVDAMRVVRLAGTVTTDDDLAATVVEGRAGAAR